MCPSYYKGLFDDEKNCNFNDICFSIVWMRYRFVLFKFLFKKFGSKMDAKPITAKQS